MALDYPVHQFDQVIRGYGQGGLGAFEQRFHFERRFHWGSLNFLSELKCRPTIIKRDRFSRVHRGVSVGASY